MAEADVTQQESAEFEREDPVIDLDGQVLPGRISASELHVSFGSKQVLHGVSLKARPGEVLAIIGPSGCGKTTFLRSLNRLTELARDARIEGSVELDGLDIYDRSLDVNAIRRRVGMVFQQPNPFPMTVFDNVAYVLREQARRRPRRPVLAPRVEEVLSHAGLWDEVKDHLDMPALRLSGGQQQRLCIARALASKPEVLLMDEPCSALDPRATAVIEELIAKLRTELTVVIVTHNLAQARRVSDRVAFFLMGDLVEEGPSDHMFSERAKPQTRDYVEGVYG